MNGKGKIQETSFFREKTLPPLSSRIPGAFYFIENGNAVDAYLSVNDRRALRIGNTDMINDLIQSALSVGAPPNTIVDYRSEFEADDYIYSGYLINSVIVIRRTKEGVDQFAQSLTDLEADWINRLILTYI